MAEHEVLGARESRATGERVQLRTHAIGERYGPRPAAGLRGPVLAPDVGAADAQLAGRPVHVPPAQPEQLALAQAGHGRGQVQRPLDRAEHVAGDRHQEISTGSRPNVVSIEPSGVTMARLRFRERNHGHLQHHLRQDQQADRDRPHLQARQQASRVLEDASRRGTDAPHLGKEEVAPASGQAAAG
jgi:hypothetical protein